MRQKVFALIDATLAALKAAGTLKLEQAPGYTVEPPEATRPTATGRSTWRCCSRSPRASRPVTSPTPS